MLKSLRLRQANSTEFPELVDTHISFLHFVVGLLCGLVGPMSPEPFVFLNFRSSRIHIACSPAFILSPGS